MDELEPNREGQPEALSVSAAMALAKRALEGVVVTIVGEVSEVSISPRWKAVYFTVKDDDASLSCLMWKNKYTASGVELQIGQLVQLTGRFTLYAAKGTMNFDVFSIQLTGEGYLRMKVAALAKKLEAEGLMLPERKRPLPEIPMLIGLVTSPDSAAVHDVLRTLRSRFPVATVLLAGVAVEGASAPAEMIEGIECVVNAGAELVLLVRGGGSYENLMPFNDETLARAIAACPVPVVTGIGHEVDTTIADLVADKRSSTPTFAAMDVSPSFELLDQRLHASFSKMSTVLASRLSASRAYIERMAEKPMFEDPMMLFASDAQALDYAMQRLEFALPNKVVSLVQANDVMRDRLIQVGGHILERPAHQLAAGAARLHDLSPLGILARGYAIARSKDGAVIHDAESVSNGECIDVSVANGTLACTVDSVSRR